MSQIPSGPCITYLHGPASDGDGDRVTMKSPTIVTTCPFDNGQCDHPNNDVDLATYFPKSGTITGSRIVGEEIIEGVSRGVIVEVKWALRMRPGETEYIGHVPDMDDLPWEWDCPYGVTVLVSENGWGRLDPLVHAEERRTEKWEVSMKQLHEKYRIAREKKRCPSGSVPGTEDEDSGTRSNTMDSSHRS